MFIFDEVTDKNNSNNTVFCLLQQLALPKLSYHTETARRALSIEICCTSVRASTQFTPIGPGFSWPGRSLGQTRFRECILLDGVKAPRCRLSRTIKPEDRVRFDEFVEYIVNGAVGGRVRDIHWETVYEMCKPCHVKYDYIGLYETIHLDAEHIIRQLARRSNRTVNTAVMFPDYDPKSPNPISREFLRPYFENVSADNIIRLMGLYRKDYETFGYKIPDEFRRKIKSLKRNVTDLKIR